MSANYSTCGSRLVRYASLMVKIIIGAIVLVLLAGGAYWYFTMNTSSEETPEGQQTQQTTEDKVEGQDITVGTGRVAEPNTQVSIEYIGQLQDGTVFDASQEGKPLVFVLGAQGIIPGFQIGVNGMKEGGERAIYIPPALAYGDQQVGTIPPNSPLIFRIKLVKVEDAPAGTTEQ